MISPNTGMEMPTTSIFTSCGIKDLNKYYDLIEKPHWKNERISSQLEILNDQDIGNLSSLFRSMNYTSDEIANSFRKEEDFPIPHPNPSKDLEQRLSIISTWIRENWFLSELPIGNDAGDYYRLFSAYMSHIQKFLATSHDRDEKLKVFTLLAVMAPMCTLGWKAEASQIYYEFCLLRQKEDFPQRITNILRDWRRELLNKNLPTHIKTSDKALSILNVHLGITSDDINSSTNLDPIELQEEIKKCEKKVLTTYNNPKRLVKRVYKKISQNPDLQELCIDWLKEQMPKDFDPSLEENRMRIPENYRPEPGENISNIALRKNYFLYQFYTPDLKALTKTPVLLILKELKILIPKK